jgi:hypothetical protein
MYKLYAGVLYWNNFCIFYSRDGTINYFLSDICIMHQVATFLFVLLHVGSSLTWVAYLALEYVLASAIT